MESFHNPSVCTRIIDDPFYGVFDVSNRVQWIHCFRQIIVKSTAILNSILIMRSEEQSNQLLIQRVCFCKIHIGDTTRFFSCEARGEAKGEAKVEAKSEARGGKATCIRHTS